MAKALRIEKLAESRLEEARALVAAYVASLGIDLSFQGIEAELADFPARYAAPDGAFLLALDGERIVGCVGLKKFGEGICEMKRLYVLDEYKGKGLGKRLVAEIIDTARSRGYGRMRLDTLPSMTAAQALYRSLGFREIPAYVYNPVEGTKYMEKDLATASASAPD